MILADDAHAFLEQFREALPWPLHQMGVEAGRNLTMKAFPTGPSLYSVEDITIDGTEIAMGAGFVDGVEEEAVPIRARVYRPVAALSLGALVYFHGGGWSIGSVDGVDAVCRVLSAEARVVVISVDYRQAPEHPFPTPLRDCWRALQWVAAGNLDGVDCARLAIGGDSAGANLAAACTLLARDAGAVNLTAQLLVYPPTDANDSLPSTREFADAPVLTSRDVRWFWDLYVPDLRDRSEPRISPKNAPTLVGLPTAIVLTAEYDPIRDDGEDYARLLAEAGVPVRKRRFDGAFHGFFPMVGLLKTADAAASYAASCLADSLTAQHSSARVL